MEMMFNGKKVWNAEEFDYSKAAIGDYVEEQVVDNAINCLPPASMTARCSQLGEPYSSRLDPDTGRWRSTYETFTKVGDGVWMYCGDCFRGEIERRGTAPVYVGRS